MNYYNDIKTYTENNFGINLSNEKIDFITNILKRKYNTTNDGILQTLFSDKRVYDEFITRLTVPETYFFRNQEHILILMDILKSDFKNRRDLIFLSAGCSTGEEPYTIAILLKEYFPEMYENSMIFGIDLNNESIETAKFGIYGQSSFRNEMMGLKNKYFSSVSPYEYKINKEVQKKVIFSQGNIINYDYKKMATKFDVIFCRNVFIYFSKEKILRVLKYFYDRMHDKSYLFVGHSEMINQITNIFQPMLLRNSFVFQKAVENIKEEQELLITNKKFIKSIRKQKAEEIFIDENENKLKEIRQCIAIENYEGARKLLTVYLKEIPNTIKGKILEATILFYEKKYDPAIQILDKLEKRTGPLFYIYFIKGLIYSESNNFSLGIKNFEKAITINSKSLISHFLLAFMCEQKRYYKSAIKYYKKIVNDNNLKIDPKIQEIVSSLSEKQLKDLAKQKVNSFSKKE